ncbi:MAG: zinc-binding dehydrogenase [Clostridia bacterium]|nr:zinc-binding dehydrogenase [Clostridia bacterium]
MKSRQIQFVAPGIAELKTIEIPAPAPGQVTVKLAVSSVSSGTERANLIGDPNISPEGPVPVRFPRILGYSSAGVITAVGEGVTDFTVGDRVGLSWSTHTEYLNIVASNVFKIDDIPFEEAALWHITTFPMAAIRKCGLEIGESAIVMGMGVLGIIAVKLLRAAGAAPIIAVDPVPEKREYALTLGADYALDPFAPDFAKTVKALTDGGAKVAIEVTGNGGALDSVLDCMAHFGHVALLGCTRNSDFTIDYYRKVHAPGITLVGAHTNARPKHESHHGWWTTADDIKAVKTMYKLGRIDFASLVEETHSPAEAPAVYARLATEKAFPLVQFDWRQL